MKISEIIEKRKKYILVVAIILVAGGYYWYNKSNSSSKQIQYVTEEAKKGTLTISISASGNVIVDRSSNIDPTITGTVANLAVNIGDKVKKGQLLFNIINDDLNVSAAKSLTSYKQALSSLESAKATKKQARYDYETSSSSKQKPALKQKVESAEASVESAQQGVVSKELNKQGHTIILITHEMDVANCADRIIYVRDGKIEKDSMRIARYERAHTNKS